MITPRGAPIEVLEFFPYASPIWAKKGRGSFEKVCSLPLGMGLVWKSFISGALFEPASICVSFLILLVDIGDKVVSIFFGSGMFAFIYPLNLVFLVSDR